MFFFQRVNQTYVKKTKTTQPINIERIKFYVELVVVTHETHKKKGSKNQPKYSNLNEYDSKYSNDIFDKMMIFYTETKHSKKKSAKVLESVTSIFQLEKKNDSFRKKFVCNGDFYRIYCVFFSRIVDRLL